MADTLVVREGAGRLRQAVIYTALCFLLSVPIGLWFLREGFVSADEGALAYFVSLNLFVAQDMWIGAAMALSVALAWVWADRSNWRPLDVPRAGVAGVAGLAVGLSLLLRFVAHHNFGLSIDEFMPLFQADIFRGGNLMAPLSDQAFAIREQLQPFFTYVDETHQLWVAHYRPIHAAILSLFPRGYEAAVAHALLTGITVLAMADIAKRVFPDRPGAPFLAAVLLIGSPQVLLTSASGFAFTTHLAFNTVWLALFLRGSWQAHVAAAAVGFFALGIHQVHVHAFYVFPFGIAMLLGYFGSRWKAVPYVVAYAVGVPLWIMWPEIATYLQTGDPGVLPRTLLEVEYLSNYFNRSSDTVGTLDRQFSGVFLVTNIWRFLVWMSPAVLLLIPLAVMAGRSLGRVAVVAGLGFLFTLVMSHLMLPNQMHTIGSRYYHVVIGNAVLVAMAGYYAFADDVRLRRATVALVLAGLVVFLPWRAYQVHEKVGPRAAVHAQLQATEAASILIAPDVVWFMPDFIRNDPYLQRGPIYYLDRGDGVVPLTDGPVLRLTGFDLLEQGFPKGTYLEPDLTNRPR